MCARNTCVYIKKEGRAVQRGISGLGVVGSALFESRSRKNGGEGSRVRGIGEDENGQNVNFKYHKRSFWRPKTGKMKKF